MIEIFFGFFILIVAEFFEKKPSQTDPEEYYPYMYDHFNDDGDWDGED